MLGVLAFGDSITNGGGELQWGVALQSWALWVARALGLPYTGYATDGATVQPTSSRLQLTGVRAAHRRTPEARYDVGCLYIGVNDVRALDWDADGSSAAYAAALDFLSARSDRVLTRHRPGRLGAPPWRPKVRAAERGDLAATPRPPGHWSSICGDFGARNLRDGRPRPPDRLRPGRDRRARARPAGRGWPPGQRQARASLISYETAAWPAARATRPMCTAARRSAPRAGALPPARPARPVPWPRAAGGAGRGPARARRRPSAIASCRRRAGCVHARLAAQPEHILGLHHRDARGRAQRELGSTPTTPARRAARAASAASTSSRRSAAATHTTRAPCRVVRSRVHEPLLDVVAGLGGLPGSLGVEAELEHEHAGQPERVAQPLDRRGYDPEVLGDERQSPSSRSTARKSAIPGPRCQCRRPRCGARWGTDQ